MLGGHPGDVPLTDEERRAIRDLRALAKRWPRSLWLWSASGSLWVMRCDAGGRHAMQPAGDRERVDDAYAVDNISGIPNDGGDW